MTDGIAILTLTHGKANALDIELCDALSERFADLHNSDAKAVVVAGQGAIFLCGRRFKTVERGWCRLCSEVSAGASSSYEAVFLLRRKNRTAAINGHAIPGGCVLACCADRRIMARDVGRISG